MLSLIPTKTQWRKWSVPSKLTCIGAYAGVVAIPLAIALFVWPTGSAGHNIRASGFSSGSFSPAIAASGSNNNVSVSYNFQSDGSEAKGRSSNNLQGIELRPDLECAYIPGDRVTNYGFVLRNVGDAPATNILLRTSVACVSSNEVLSLDFY